MWSREVLEMANGHVVMGLGSAEKRRSTRDAMQFIWRFSRDESGIITAQNILVDGGLFPGTL